MKKYRKAIGGEVSDDEKEEEITLLLKNYLKLFNDKKRLSKRSNIKKRLYN